MIYGYKESVVDDEHGLLQLREVTFAMTPQQLWLAADFLNHVAVELELGKPFSHRHIGEVLPGWSASHPSADIIATSPEIVTVPAF